MIIVDVNVTIYASVIAGNSPVIYILSLNEINIGGSVDDREKDISTSSIIHGDSYRK